MNNIAKIIKEKTGLKIKDFCERELHVQYKAFIARVANRRLYPAEIFYIIYRTKASVQELFGMPWHELIILSQGGGEITEKVRHILSTMSEEEKKEIAPLMGIPAPGSGEAIKKEEERNPTVQEQVDLLKKFFRQTY